ncbi:unnamed protein product [Sphenostylis stenocarpa]|uniref:glucan endo-1,3-beta-D-glucosidase n=1 Tax=Sphenostylis stenocarpa TaxID=92480 RepID=A0AA86SBC3_9FABA|nr:unnamed protein product [Sphenostylis stenocarpa]
MGLAYGDTQLIATGSTLAAMEIHAAPMWWHLGEGHKLYEEDYTRENKVVSVLWANKRDNVGYVKELVEWTMPNLNRKCVGEGMGDVEEEFGQGKHCWFGHYCQ